VDVFTHPGDVIVIVALLPPPQFDNAVAEMIPKMATAKRGIRFMVVT
jgi:hypothetical protein